VNEDHLYEGTKLDNAHDRMARNYESYDYLKTEEADIRRRLAAKAYWESPEGQEHWKRIQPMGIKARWSKDTSTKK
jgi:hypothetical protein